MSDILDLEDIELMNQILRQDDDSTNVDEPESSPPVHVRPEDDIPQHMPLEQHEQVEPERRPSRLISLVHQVTKKRIEQAVGRDTHGGNIDCSVCHKIFTNKRSHLYHVTGHFASNICECGFSHYDLREVRKHQKYALACETARTYTVCPLSMQKYLRVTKLDPAPTGCE